MVVGENGILNRATDASKKTNDASSKEKSDFDKMTDLIDETVSGIKTVEQVIDEHPGALEINGNEQIINSIEDLVFFAYDVTNGNTYEGQTVKLGLNLDFNSSKSYVNSYRTDYGKYGYNGELKTLLTSGKGFLGIGDINKYDSNSFHGNFDGNGKLIKNLFINIKENQESYIGLFSCNYGNISNLGLENVNINVDFEVEYSGRTVFIGGIAGINFGSIMTSFVNGIIEGNCSYLDGGVASQIRMGGLCGNNRDIGTIENCYNVANLINKGNNFQNSSSEIGGITGKTLIGTKLRNCYNIGLISEENNYDIEKGGICGGISKNNVLFENCYYEESSCNIGITSVDTSNYENNDLLVKTSDEMKNSDFIDLLNTGNDVSVWVEDENNINNGYPILNWQVEN